MQLDYSLKTPEERIECVNRLIAETPDEKLTSQYLKYMSDYILFVGDRSQTKKEKQSEYPVVTKNREVTIKKRQVSYEEIVANLENGEDGIYALLGTNSKSTILDPKDPIDTDDLEKIQGLKEEMNKIKKLKHAFDNAKGQDRYFLKRQIIETWQQIYILKAATQVSMHKGTGGQIKQLAHTSFPENCWLDNDEMPQSDGLLTLFNPYHVSFLLCYYSKLKAEVEDQLFSDMHWLLVDLENIATDALLEKHAMFYDLIIWKVDGLSNAEIQEEVLNKYGEWHSEQYYSTVWRNRIPKLIAEEAKKQFLIWYFTNVEYGTWLHCNKCGRYLPAHSMFFAKNSSKTGYYSMCKECKNERSRKK